MIRHILYGFCIMAVITNLAISQESGENWIPFLQQTKSKPYINLTTSNNNNVSFTVQINGMLVSDKKVDKKSYKQLSIPETDLLFEEGAPQVPVITKLIAIPDCDDVSISVTPSNKMEFAGYYIVPAPKYEKKILPDGSDRKELVFEENDNIYSSSTDFPGKPGEIIEVGYVRDQKVARVSIYPIQFNPAEKKIKVFTDFNINLSFVNPKSSVNKELGIFRNLMHHTALNYELSGISASTKGKDINKGSLGKITTGSVTRVTNLNTLVGTNAIPVDYLIITHSSLFNSSYLTALANHRMIYNGYDVAICFVDETGTNDIYHFEDPPGTVKYPSAINTRYVSIRNFIRDVYLNGTANHTGDGKLAYICLVGDALLNNNSTVMLPAAMPTYYSASYERGGDYYYACTGGDSDNLLDLMYGRISIGDETELNNVVSKIISYENNSNGNWNSNSTFVSFSPDLWQSLGSDNAIRNMTEIIPPTQSKNYSFRAWDTSAATAVLEADIFEQRLTTIDYYDATKNCGADILNNWIYDDPDGGLNNGIHTFIYEGHGGWNSLGAGEGDGRFTFYLNGARPKDPGNLNSVNTRLNNDLYTFMIFNACDAGHLDHNSGDCVGEVVVNFANRGAIGCIAASRDVLQSSAPFNVVDTRVVRAMYENLSHIMGEAFMESKLVMSNALRRPFNLYGDPAVNLFPTGYTIPENITISGSHTISENISVAAGATLTIAAGSNIRFENGTSITVNGTLVANGTSTNGIILDFVSPGTITSQNGIFITSTGSASISYCEILNAYKGISITTSTSNTISHNNIHDNAVGIYCLGSRSTSMTISENDISFNSVDGIYLNNSTPTISKNTIYGNIRNGITCYNYSAPSLNHALSGNNNNIYGNEAGIFADYHSTPEAGRFGSGKNIIMWNVSGLSADNTSTIYAGWAPDGGVNSIYENTDYNVYANHSSTVIAQNNWWGDPLDTDLFKTENGSSISYLPLIDPYNNPLSKTNPSGSEVVLSDGFMDEELKTAIGLQKKGEYREAINLYKKIILNSLETNKGIFSLSALNECFENLKDDGLIEFLNSSVKNKISQKGPLDRLCRELEIRWMILDNNFSGAIEKFNKLIIDYAKEDNIVKNALFNKGYIYFTYLSDVESAENVFSVLERSYPGDDLVINSKLLLGKEIPGMKNRPEQDKKEVPEITDFKLLGNYPNPFNPSTVIKYSLPKESFVEVRIFDMLGKEVKTFILGSQPAGNQNLIWNGTNNYNEQISSGIYIYRFKACSVQDGKVFEASAKLLMIK